MKIVTSFNYGITNVMSLEENDATPYDDVCFNAMFVENQFNLLSCHHVTLEQLMLIYERLHE